MKKGSHVEPQMGRYSHQVSNRSFMQWLLNPYIAVPETWK